MDTTFTYDLVADLGDGLRKASYRIKRGTATYGIFELVEGGAADEPELMQALCKALAASYVPPRKRIRTIPGVSRSALDSILEAAVGAVTAASFSSAIRQAARTVAIDMLESILHIDGMPAAEVLDAALARTLPS
jgi:crotonobetainyl-CoA:carnitine CoA-transferase CaiB-like acyl-CoA transferase